MKEFFQEMSFNHIPEVFAWIFLALLALTLSLTLIRYRKIVIRSIRKANVEGEIYVIKFDVEERVLGVKLKEVGSGRVSGNLMDDRSYWSVVPSGLVDDEEVETIVNRVRDFKEERAND